MIGCTCQNIHICRCYRPVKEMRPLNLPKKKKGKNEKSQIFVKVKSLVKKKRCKKNGASKGRKKTGENIIR